MSAPAPILEPAAYAHVFGRWRGARVREFWGPGNVGDLLIRRGAEQLYAAYKQASLTLEEFEGPRYQRIGHIQRLLSDGILTTDLRHARPKAA